jgi:hypothetical protein
MIEIPYLIVFAFAFFLCVITFLEDKKLVKHPNFLFALLFGVVIIFFSKIGPLEDFDLWLFVGVSASIIVLDVIVEIVLKKLKIDY